LGDFGLGLLGLLVLGLIDRGNSIFGGVGDLALGLFGDFDPGNSILGGVGDFALGLFGDFGSSGSGRTSSRTGLKALGLRTRGLETFVLLKEAFTFLPFWDFTDFLSFEIFSIPDIFKYTF
jgi:hypothetical protein